MRSLFHLVSAIGATVAIGALLLTGPTGCSASSAGGGADSTELVGADDSLDGRAAESVLGSVAVGSTLKTTSNVNLRTGPSTGAHVIHVIPSGALVTVVAADPQHGFYNVKHNGAVGWSFGAYLAKAGSAPPPPPPPGGGSPPPSSSSGRDGAIERAQEGVGFSYWWGHGRWLPGGPSSSTAGSCSGSCPSCSHSGTYGADCSGYIGKIWQVPSSNTDVTADDHPYSTGSFVSDTSQWSTVSRGSVQKGDAFVYNSGGAGHIFLYESGDGWGSMWAYEAKGCATGVVHDLRTSTGSAYHAIARSGY
ncbi:MAG: hypothetical protein NVS3B10_09740 [Polyangiales bacterium]